MDKCQKVRSFFPLFLAQNLDECDSKLVKLHLDQCPNCQKSLEKSRNLRTLLSLKRYEQPGEFFFRTYVSEFHRRICSEVLQKNSIWFRLREVFSAQIGAVHWMIRAVSYSAGLAVILLSLYTAHLSMKNSVSESAFARRVQMDHDGKLSPVVDVTSHTSDLVLASDNSSGRASVYVLDRVDYKPSTHAPILLSF